MFDDISQCYGTGCDQRLQCNRYDRIGYSNLLRGTYMPIVPFVVYEGRQVCPKFWDKQGER